MAVSVEQFAQRLTDSGIMSADEVQAFLNSRHPRDDEQLARELVEDGKLTTYQARSITRGKGESLVLGNYVILEQLGKGGMGTVFKAEHRRMQRIVALKVLSPGMTENAEAVERFHREVKAAAKLSHPNIVTAYDADESKGTHFLVMEYVEGRDLHFLVKKQGPLPVDKAVDCILQAARGLDYAHTQGIIHRDIKPANLLLDNSGSVKILDMGLARMETENHSELAPTELTGAGAVMGTIDFMSPEQALGTKHADQRSDIYSLGISLYYLLAGKPAYSGESALAKLLAHRESPIPSLPGVPEPLNAIFRKMVAKQPEDRYQTMAKVIAELEALPSLSASPLGLASGNVQAEPDETVGGGTEVLQDEHPTTQAERNWWQSPRVQVAGGIAALVVAFALVAIRLNMDDSERGLSSSDDAASAEDMGRDGPGTAPGGIDPLFPDDEHDMRVNAWKVEAREVEALFEVSSSDVLQDGTYDSSNSLQRKLDAAADARRTQITLKLKDLGGELDEIKELRDERKKQLASVQEKEGPRPETQMASQFKGELELIEAREETIKQLELDYGQLQRKTDGLSFIDSDARNELTELTAMEQLNDNWDNDAAVSPSLLTKARTYVQNGDPGLRFLGLATLARSKSLPDLELVAKEVDSAELGENQAARLGWWLAHSGESRVVSQGVNRFHQSPTLLAEVDKTALVDAVFRSPDQWRVLLPDMFRQIKDPHTSLELLELACQFRDSRSVKPILDSLAGGGLKGADAKIVCGILESRWQEAYSPVVNKILKDDPHLNLTDLDVSILKELSLQRANAETVGVLAGHLLNNGDIAQMQWAVDIFDQSSDILTVEQFQSRLGDSVKVTHTAVLNYLLEKRSDKALGQAEWLLREHAGSITPDAIRKELLVPVVLARQSLETAILDALWRGNTSSRDWALTQELGQDTREQFVDLRAQIREHRDVFNDLAAWLDGGKRRGQYVVLASAPATLTAVDFDKEFIQFEAKGQSLFSAWNSRMQGATGKRVAGDKGLRFTAHKALKDYMDSAGRLLETSRDIWKNARSPLKSKTRNLTASKYQKLQGDYAKCRSVASELDERERQIPWSAD